VTLAQDFLNAERDQDSAPYQFLAYSISSDGKAVQHSCEHQGLLITMVDVLEAWYRHIPGDFRDAFPLAPMGPRDTATREANLRLLGLKNKKGICLLAHLRGLLALDHVAAWVGTTRDFAYRLGQFIDLFSGMQPQNHETRHHINYEVDYYKGFNLLSELASLIRNLGECYKHSQLYEIFDVMRFTALRINNDVSLWNDTYDQEKTWAPRFRPVVFTYPPGGKTLDLIEQQLHGIEGFSFHHYNHFMLAEMINSLASTLTLHRHPVDFSQVLNMVLATDDNTFLRWYHHQIKPSADSKKILEATLLLIEQPLSSEYW